MGEGNEALAFKAKPLGMLVVVSAFCPAPRLRWPERFRPKLQPLGMMFVPLGQAERRTSVRSSAQCHRSPRLTGEGRSLDLLSRLPAIFGTPKMDSYDEGCSSRWRGEDDSTPATAFKMNPLTMKMNPLTMKTTLTVACVFLKSAWQAVSLCSALTALLLAPMAVLHAADTATPPGDRTCQKHRTQPRHQSASRMSMKPCSEDPWIRRKGRGYGRMH